MGEAPGRSASPLGGSWATGAVVGAVLLAYANSLGGSFHFDDESSIVEHPCLGDLGCTLRAGGAVGARLVAYLSFGLNHRLGGLDPTGYHVVNILVHAGASLALLALARLTLELALRGRPLVPRHRDGAALLAALLFACHPIQTQAVTYVVQRMASLATLFYLLSLLLYARSRLAERPGARAAFLASAVATAVLAMKTKEIAFTLPFAALLYDVAFLEGPLRARARALAPMLATALVIPLAWLDLGRGLSGAVASAAVATRIQTEMPRLVYFLHEWPVVVRYLGLLLLPVGQSADPDLLPRSDLATAPVIASGLLLLALSGLGVALLLRPRRPEGRVAGFGICFFFIAASVESSFIPFRDLMFEHRVYLPLAGAALAAAAGALAIVRFRPSWERPLAAAAALWVLALGAATVARNGVWRDEETLWRDTVAKSPWNARAHYHLGNALRERGDLAAAARLWQRATELRPSFSSPWNQLGHLAAREGDIPRAIALIQRALEIDPKNAEARYNLAALLEQQGLHEEAVQHYRQFVATAPPSLADTAREVRRRFGWLDP